METKKAILVVEDDPDSAEMLVEMLSMADYEVDAARTADRAVTALESGRYGAAVLDLTLPGVSTGELIERIAGVKDRPPIVIFSARTADDLRRAAERLSAVAVLQKPMRMDSLLAAVARVARPSAA